MTQLHLAFTIGSAVAAIGLVVVAAAGAIGRRRVHLALDRLVLLGFGAVALAAASGLILLGDHEPADGLHLVYGVVALAVLPVARSWAASAPARERVILATAGIVLGLLLWRLFQTG